MAVLNKSSYRSQANSGSISGGIPKMKPYERCHLLGKQLSGSNTNKANFVFCWPLVNDPTMKRYENIVKNRILADDVIIYGVKAVYDDSHGISKVPVTIEMAAYSYDEGAANDYTGNGLLFDTNISNTVVPHESPGTLLQTGVFG